ncbi:MAG: ABC transporter permease subunit [Oscillospiraceae bacterium]|jgi:putative aldouronate transport system permease protein|nr:ABC transporter permease subunit [Oscillospiraceae bacterium]
MKKISPGKKTRFWRAFRRQWDLQLMVLPAIVVLILFSYLPMSGIIIAFKDFTFRKGIFGSDWVGLKHFQSIITDPFVHRALYNTVMLSLLRLAIVFPAPLIFALMLNEMRFPRLKRVYQTMSYLPYFVSWAIVCAMVPVWLAPNTGFVNSLLQFFGIIKEPVAFLSEPGYFYGLTIILELWKSIGFSAIIYLAAIAGIDQEQYEAAMIDGASKFQKMRYITIPSIRGTVSLLFILSISGILGGNFDVSYLLGNGGNISRSEILQTYNYHMGIIQGRFSYATMVGLMLGVVALAFLLIGNAVIKKLTKTSGLF